MNFIKKVSMMKSPIMVCFSIYCLIKVVVLEYLNSGAYRTWCLHVFCFYYSFHENQLHSTIMMYLFIFYELSHFLIGAVFSLLLDDDFPGATCVFGLSISQDDFKLTIIEAQNNFEDL